MSNIDNELIVKAAEYIYRAKNLIVFTGAGMSADSGIPTFRGEDGLWNRYRPEDLATLDAFLSDPVKVWRWYLWRISRLKSVKPHKGYNVLSRWYRIGILKYVITQNVDGLFIESGIDKVIELHGNILRARCTSCRYSSPIDKLDKSSLPIICPRCYGLMRPDVVWFGEPLNPSILDKAYQLARESDVMLVIGTSGVVYPAAYIPYIAKESGSKVIEINVEESMITEISDIFIGLRAAEALTYIDKYLSRYR